MRGGVRHGSGHSLVPLLLPSVLDAVGSRRNESVVPYHPVVANLRAWRRGFWMTVVRIVAACLVSRLSLILDRFFGKRERSEPTRRSFIVETAHFFCVLDCFLLRSVSQWRVSQYLRSSPVSLLAFVEGYGFGRRLLPVARVSRFGEYCFDIQGRCGLV